MNIQDDKYNEQIDNQINSQDILNAIDLNKINQNEKKKRGRPKKTQILLTNTNKLKIVDNKEFYDLEEEEIILHLPLSKSDLAKINIDNLEMEENNEENNEKNNEENNEEQILYTHELINSNPNIYSENESSDIKISNTVDNYQYIKQLFSTIKKLKEENFELKKYLTEITPMYFTEIKVYPSNLNLFDLENNKFKPTKTNLCCWWCTYKFENFPTYLPEKYSENNFYVTGCFCSFNCAGAYNLSLGDNKVWNRYSLLKLLYYMIYKDKINSINDVEINSAGPKELLDKYGGSMNINEYRKNSKIIGREYHKLSPPFIPINIGFKEITNSKINNNICNLTNIMNSSKNHDNLIKKNKI